MEFCFIIRLVEGSETDAIYTLIESTKLRVDVQQSCDTLVGSQACNMISQKRAEKLIISASNILRRPHMRGKVPHIMQAPLPAQTKKRAVTLP